MKKVLLSLLLLVFMAPFAMRADEVVIGQGTGSDYNTPFNVFYKISWHESIYPASSFDMPCVINSVAYHCATTDVTYPTTEINIYMGMTQRNSIESTTDWTPMEDLTLVYSGSDIVLGDEEWESFTLDTPFEYSRNGNLVIVVAKAADGWTSSLKYFNTDSEDGSYVAMYRQSDTDASYMEHPGAATGTRIKKVADVKLGTSPAQPGGIMVTPSEIALGVRPNGAWMRPTSFEIAATSGYANVNVLESTNSFFVLEDVELPLIILGGEPKTIEVTTGEAPAGEINANIVVAYAEGRGTELVNISATAYDPVCPDVWEMAQEVSSYPYSDTPDYASLYDNYQLPGEGEDGADAVYELTFEEDVMLTVEVTGENHKQALYQEGFNGVGGPSVDNNYFGVVIPEMPEIGEGSQFEYGFEAGLEGWTIIDANTDGHTWYHTTAAGDHSVLVGDSHSGTGHVMSESYCNASWLAIEPDDYIIAPEKAVLAVGSTFKFYASAQDENYAAEHFGVAISTNGNTSASDFTTIAEWTLSAKGGQKAARNANGVRQGAWYEYTVDLSAYAGQEAWIAIRHFGCADQFILLVDDASLSIGMKRDEAISYEINNMVVPAGTYYLATSATEPFSVNINAETMPAPEKATEPYPANYAQNVSNPSLAWQFGAYTVEYQVLLGTTYPPTEVIIDWTNDLQIGHRLNDLYNNKNYFWQVNVRNTTGTTYGDVWAFTTKLNVPTNVAAVEPEIYVGDDAVINWTAVQDRSYRGYNVYVDGVKNNTSLVTATTYTVSGLEYDMEGYEIAVTAVYDEGESQLSTPAMVYVSGEGAIEGYVFDQDGVTPIAAANVEVKGKDEFNRNQTYTFTTDENGLYSGAVLAGTYKVTASEANYQTIAVEDIVVAYAETTTGVNLSMTEVYTPVYQVIAEEVDPSIVKVYWSWSEIIPDALIDDFETGDFSALPWNNEVTPSYPWAITTTNPYEGTYSMMSGCAGVDDGSSSIELTVEVPYDGAMSFYHRISSEASWDNAYFYIDGVQVLTVTGEMPWSYREVAVTEGVHTYMWNYTKDFIVSSGEDAYYVDYVSCYQPIEPFEGGWLYYDNGAYASSVGTGSPSPMYWGAMFPNADGMTLTKVQVYDPADSGVAGSADVTANIYVGGTDAPGTLVASEPLTFTGSSEFIEVELSTPVTVDGQLWITFYCPNLPFPAAGCSYVGEPNSDWLSLDGSTWEHAADYNLSYTWMIRGYVESAKGERAVISNSTKDARYPQYEALTFEGGASTGTIVANAASTPVSVGVPSNTSALTRDVRAIQSYKVYRTNCYTEDYTEETVQLLGENITDTIFTDVHWGSTEPGVYKWGVSAVYEGNRSSSAVNNAKSFVPEAGFVARPNDVLEYNGEVVLGNVDATMFRGDMAYANCVYPMGMVGGYVTFDIEDPLGAVALADATVDRGGEYFDGVFYGYSSANTFNKINVETGEVIESLPVSTIMTEMAYDYSRGVMYGIGNTVADGALYTIDLETGAATQVGTLGTAFMAFGIDLEGNAYGVAISTGDFYAINLDDMTAEFVGATGQGCNYVQCGGFNHNDGTFYWFQCYDTSNMALYTIDVTTGAATLVAPGVGEVTSFFVPFTYGGGTGVYPFQGTNESPIVWSDECIDKDMFTTVEATVETNSGDSPAGTIITLTSMSEPEMGYDYEATLDNSGYFAWDEFRKGTYELTIAKEGFTSCATAVVMDIWEATEIDCLLEEIALAVEGLYVSPTGWAMWEGANLGGGGGEPMSEWLYYDDGANVDAIGGPASFYWGVRFPADMMSEYAGTFLTTVSMYDYAATSGGQIMIYFGGETAPTTLVHTQDYSGTGSAQFVDYELTSAIPVDGTESMWIVMSTVMGTSYPASCCNNVGNLDSRWISMDGAVWEDLVGYGLNYSWMLRGYVTNEFKGEVSELRPIEMSYMTGEGEFVAAGKANVNEGSRALTSYSIFLNGNLEAELLVPYYQHENLVVGDEYTTTVIANYTTGGSEPMEYTWTYAGCDPFAGATEFTAEYTGGNAVLNWTLPGSDIQGETFNYGFESGLDGWTTIDANSDGHTWYHNSQAGDHGTISTDSHGGTGHLMSESYCNATWMSMEPDDYLVSPQKYAMAAGSTITFWACAQDANYPSEHFGVAVSTGSNGSGSDFTMVGEWTIGGKGDRTQVRDAKDPTPWTEYTVDLSAYAGQEVWIAIRHFNCYDQFILLVDDVEIVTGEGNGPNPPTPGDAFSFEDGLEGWTTIDANSDGHTWYHNSQAGDHSVLSADSHTGAGHLMSESYCNATWMSMEPDDYIVSPSKIAVGSGTTMTFWACAQDANYPSEHFGVAVSTAGNSSASDFTTVAEWTIGGKGDRTQVRDAKDPTPWTQYTADLSAYAGQEVWVAIRHFDCYDQFILLVDDVEFGSAKGTRAAWDLMNSFNLTSAGQQGIATDGNFIYTCSWQSAPSGGYGYYKYDLEGNFIEGFDISGATQVRDLTYDGEYFYGSSGSSKIYILDLEGKTKVGEINCSGLTARHLSYDPEMDAFWSGDWSTLALYDRNGAMITNGPAPSSAYGSGYIVDENGNPHLYLFCQPASDAKVYDFDINANTLGTTPIFDFANTPGFQVGSGISGGAFIGSYNGKTAFFGNVQQEPNLVGIYELGEGGVNPPTPNEDIIGVMVYRDGELLTEEPVTTGTYSDPITDGEAHEYCIRVVYGGNADETLYAMSCPECITVEPAMACDAPEDLYAEQSADEDGVILTWPYTQAMSEWLYYDDGVNVDAIGGPASFYWGIQFPAASLAPYAGTSLTKVSMYDYTANSGGQIMIYQGGTSAPATLVHTQDFTGTGSAQFVEYELTSPIPVDETQPMWIVMSTVMGTSYPASCCNNTGDANGRWISMDGAVWEDVAGYGLNYTWMIRGYVTTAAKGEVELGAIDFEYTVGEGEFAAAGKAVRSTRELDHYNIYRGTSSTSFELVGETDASPYFDALEEDGTYYYQVTAVYVDGDEECESDPANSYEDPDQDYVVVDFVSLDENGVNGMMMYPNPTKGDLNIKAEGMERISISNALGQMIYDQAVTGDNEIVDMSQYEAGVYMVRIVTESGVAVKRITVIR